LLQLFYHHLTSEQTAGDVAAAPNPISALATPHYPLSTSRTTKPPAFVPGTKARRPSLYHR